MSLGYLSLLSQTALEREPARNVVVESTEALRASIGGCGQ